MVRDSSQMIASAGSRLLGIHWLARSSCIPSGTVLPANIWDASVPSERFLPIPHDNEGLAVLFANFVDGANVRMVQGRGSLGFALKAAECLRVFGYVVGQELEGYEATELHILGFVG
jgi:hypothetical protein